MKSTPPPTTTVITNAAATNNKQVLKDCKFPLSLDVHELCAPALQARLAPERDAFKSWTDHKTELAVTDALAAASGLS